MLRIKASQCWSSNLGLRSQDQNASKSDLVYGTKHYNVLFDSDKGSQVLNSYTFDFFSKFLKCHQR